MFWKKKKKKNKFVPVWPQPWDGEYPPKPDPTPPPPRPVANQISPGCSISFSGGISPNITKTLTERGARYGEFPEHARISQNIKRAMQDSPNWDNLPPAHREALEMIAHKIARVLNGDPDYDDSWHDLAGYATLVEQYILSEK